MSFQFRSLTATKFRIVAESGQVPGVPNLLIPQRQRGIRLPIMVRLAKAARVLTPWKTASYFRTPIILRPARSGRRLSATGSTTIRSLPLKFANYGLKRG
jgi:hypothetical protein